MGSGKKYAPPYCFPNEHKVDIFTAIKIAPAINPVLRKKLRKHKILSCHVLVIGKKLAQARGITPVKGSTPF